MPTIYVWKLKIVCVRYRQLPSKTEMAGTAVFFISIQRPYCTAHFPFSLFFGPRSDQSLHMSICRICKLCGICRLVKAVNAWVCSAFGNVCYSARPILHDDFLTMPRPRNSNSQQTSPFRHHQPCPVDPWIAWLAVKFNLPDAVQVHPWPHYPSWNGHICW